MQTAQGNLAAALTSYQASHDIFARLAEADPVTLSSRGGVFAGFSANGPLQVPWIGA